MKSNRLMLIRVLIEVYRENLTENMKTQRGNAESLNVYTLSSVDTVPEMLMFVSERQGTASFRLAFIYFVSSRVYHFLVTWRSSLNKFWLTKWNAFASVSKHERTNSEIILKLEFSLVSIFTVGFSALLLDVPVRRGRRKWNTVLFTVWCQQVDGNICERLKVAVNTDRALWLLQTFLLRVVIVWYLICRFLRGVYSSYRCTDRYRSLMLLEVEAPRIFRHSAHRGGKVVIPTYRPPLPPGEGP